MLNRRTFFQAAALLPAAVLQGKGRTIPPQTATKPAVVVEMDLAEPGAAEYIGSSATDLFVRLEELNPADPGELSGATLRIMQSGEYVYLIVAIGDVLQRDGFRSSHQLGQIDAAGLASIVSIDPRAADEGFCVPFHDDQDREAYSHVWLTFFSGVNPELRVSILSSHCLGVLRGELLSNFFHCLRERYAHA